MKKRSRPRATWKQRNTTIVSVKLQTSLPNSPGWIHPEFISDESLRVAILFSL